MHAQFDGTWSEPAQMPYGFADFAFVIVDGALHAFDGDESQLVHFKLAGNNWSDHEYLTFGSIPRIDVGPYSRPSRLVGLVGGDGKAHIVIAKGGPDAWAILLFRGRPPFGQQDWDDPVLIQQGKGDDSTPIVEAAIDSLGSTHVFGLVGDVFHHWVVSANGTVAQGALESAIHPRSIRALPKTDGSVALAYVQDGALLVATLSSNGLVEHDRLATLEASSYTLISGGSQLSDGSLFLSLVQDNNASFLLKKDQVIRTGAFPNLVGIGLAMAANTTGVFACSREVQYDGGTYTGDSLRYTGDNLRCTAFDSKNWHEVPPAPTIRADADWPDIAVTSDGIVHVVWTAVRAIWYAQLLNGQVRDVRLLSFGIRGYGGGPRVLADDAGTIHIAFWAKPGGYFRFYHVTRTKDGDWTTELAFEARSPGPKAPTQRVGIALTDGRPCLLLEQGPGQDDDLLVLRSTGAKYYLTCRGPDAKWEEPHLALEIRGDSIVGLFDLKLEDGLPSLRPRLPIVTGGDGTLRFLRVRDASGKPLGCQLVEIENGLGRPVSDVFAAPGWGNLYPLRCEGVASPDWSGASFEPKFLPAYAWDSSRQYAVWAQPSSAGNWEVFYSSKPR